MYVPTTAYPTAGPAPNTNNNNPEALPRRGAGMHSLIMGTNNGVNIVPQIPKIDCVVNCKRLAIMISNVSKTEW